MASMTEAGLTFSLDVSSHGAASLRDTVMNKLSEFMGSYTDDVLAEYVVVLVGHGKHRAQAVKDLEAFLGDQSEAFVTWLWDHLSTNIHLYTSVLKPSRPSSSKDGFGSSEQLVTDTSKELAKNNHADAQSEVKSRVQVSSVTHEEERPARFRKDAGKDADLKLRKDPDTGTSFFGREKPGLRSGNYESDMPTTNELSRGRGSTRPSKRPRSPDSWAQKERNLSDERHHHKRHASPPRVNATRRLLQSAVREAVAPAAGHLKRLESSLKRLRSVVSADVENSESVADANGQQPLKATMRTDAVRQGKRAIPAMIVAMKAAAAAAEDVNKVRGRQIGSVWDRLGKKSGEGVDNKEEEDHEVMRDGGDGREEVESRFVGTNRHESESKIQKRTRLGSVSDRVSKDSTEDDPAVLSDPMMDEYTEGHSAGGRNMYSVGLRGGKYQADERDDDGFLRAVSYNEGQRARAKDRIDQSREESVTVQYRLAQNMEEDVKETHKQKVSNSSSGLANSSQKIVNISVNVNTWKPRPYETLKDAAASEQPTTALTLKQPQDQPDKAADVDPLKVNDANEFEEENDSDQDVSDMKKRMRQVQLEMTKLRARQAEVTKEVQKATSPTVPGAKQVQSSQDDPDTRTVFVTNIHFAATKESVMAHFTRCGDIDRIVMLTDGATGQPKGSAYVEFHTKDAAEKALTLNESSFFSRVLKVVHKDAANQAIQEVTPVLVRPPVLRRPIPLSLRVPIRSRFMRGSPYLLRRFPSMPRPYGNSPNLQWKRDAATPGGNMNPALLNGNRPGYGPIRPARSLSYVRSATNPATQTPETGEEQKSVAGQGEKDGIEQEMEEGVLQEQKDDTEVGQTELVQEGG